MMEAPAIQNQVQPAKVRSGKDMIIVRNVDKLPELRRWEDGEKGLIHRLSKGRMADRESDVVLLTWNYVLRSFDMIWGEGFVKIGVLVCRTNKLTGLLQMFKVHCLYSFRYFQDMFQVFSTLGIRQDHWQDHHPRSNIVNCGDFRTGCPPKSLWGSMLKMQRRRGEGRHETSTLS